MRFATGRAWLILWMRGRKAHVVVEGHGFLEEFMCSLLLLHVD